MKKMICCLLCLIVAVSMLSGCGQADSQKTNAVSDDMLSDSSFSTEMKKKDEYIKVTENKNLELHVNGKTTEFYVKDKRTGKEWYSSAGANESNGSLRSQIQLTYANNSSQISTMNSYTDGVELEQYLWESCDNGIKVIYDIGKREKNYCIPKVITKSRMEDKIFSQLEDADRSFVEGMYTLNSLKNAASEVVKADLIKKYPKIKQEDVYVLYDGLADFVSEKLEKKIISAGYTQDDLTKDHSENNVQEKDKSISFRIPVEYRLEEDSLSAKITADQMVLPNNATLLSLDFLPYFGAANNKETGYIFVPDGCGAIIRLNNGKVSQKDYKMPMYGTDLATKTADNLVKKQLLSFPVYGMKQGNSGFLTVIESGAEVAELRAAIAGSVHPYNYVYPSFTLNNTEKADVPYSQATSMYFYQKNITACDLQLKFCFLSEEYADYSGMARRYQRYLMENGILKDKNAYEPALYLNLLGAIDREDNILGVPVKKIIALTSFSEAETIVKKLHEKGVSSVVVRYDGWCNGGVFHAPFKGVKVQKQLGGVKAQKQFQKLMDDMGDRVYWNVDLQYIYKNSLFDGYSNIFDAPRTIMGETAYAQRYDLVTENVTQQIGLLSPAKYQEYADNVIEKLTECASSDVSLGAMSNLLYSDFNREHFIDRQQAAEKIAETVELFRKNGKVLGNQPSDYVLKSLSEATGVPGDSNGYSIFDEEVPFYQMVIHGYIAYSGNPLNYANNIEEETLHMIETGTMPNFEWMYQPNSALKKIKSDYYAVSYQEWLDDAVQCYAKVAEALHGLQGECIVRHSKNSGVSWTEYENGTKIYVNYNYKNAIMDGYTIAGRQSLVVQGRRS